MPIPLFNFSDKDYTHLFNGIFCFYCGIYWWKSGWLGVKLWKTLWKSDSFCGKLCVNIYNTWVCLLVLWETLWKTKTELFKNELSARFKFWIKLYYCWDRTYRGSLA